MDSAMTSEVNELSDNQRQFVEDAEEQDLEIKYDYSGRLMYGRTCPAVIVSTPADFNTDADTFFDNMGLNFVVYAKN